MNEKKLRILLADGGLSEFASTLRAVCSETGHALELTTVSTIETMIPTIKVVNPDVLFLDLDIASPNPRNAVRIVHRSAPNVPLIVFASAAGKDIAGLSVNDGAMEYLLKESMDLPTIRRILNAALERNTVQGLTDLLRDELTSLYTRDGFLTIGKRTLESTRLEGGTIVLLCALFENLPALRSNFGLAAADRSICEISEMLTSCFRDADFVARIGDGQFAVLAVNASIPSAPVLLQRIQKRLALLNQACGSSGTIELRFSVGIWSPADSRSFPEFLDSIESELRQPIVVPGDKGKISSTVFRG